jgi:phage-related protein
MADIGAGCHELRIVDGSLNWRIMHHIGTDAIVILDAFAKKTAAMPKSVIAEYRRRLAEFYRVVGRQKGASRARR